MMSVDILDNFYDSDFYDELQQGTSSAAKKIVPLLLQWFNPASVVDVGCGIGTWLAVFKEFSSNIRVQGIDGIYNEERLLIKREEFWGYNLEERLSSSSSKFDLAISLEVAEHLSPQRGETFVADLACLSNVILFSAALPGQGGTNHVNEQGHNYWIKLFMKSDFFPVDWVRPQLFDDCSIPFWYLSNTLLFLRRDCILNFDFGKFDWNTLQRRYFERTSQRHSPCFFERLGMKLDQNPVLTGIKKFLKKKRREL